MEIVSSVDGMRHLAAAARRAGRTVGFVPTMGALHRGHEELLARAAARNDLTVLSIFVNPSQFNDPADYVGYPRTWDADVAVAERTGVDVVFAPGADEMYPPGFSASVSPGPLADPMEGAHRPGHFDGVATVVVKLLNIVAPDRAYFGEKDFQQLAVVRSVVRDLALPVEIVGVATVRDADGLALSSRNVRLGPADRLAAAVLHRALVAGRAAHHEGCTVGGILRRVNDELATEPRCRTEYVTVVDARSLADLPRDEPAARADDDAGATICVAAWFGEVRLIDNIALST